MDKKMPTPVDDPVDEARDNSGVTDSRIEGAEVTDNPSPAEGTYPQGLVDELYLELARPSRVTDISTGPTTYYEKYIASEEGESQQPRPVDRRQT